MGQLINLVGQKFGNLTVLERAPGKNKQVYWTCQCDCGTIKDVKSQHLREGKIKTCGRCNANTIIGQQFKNWIVLEATGRNYPIHIHTDNAVARERMRAIIQRNGWTEVK